MGEGEGVTIMTRTIKTGLFDIEAGESKRGNRLTPLALWIIFLFFAVTAYGRNIVWINDMALWSDASAKSPFKGRVYNDMGVAYARMGRLDEAEKAFLTALRLRPDVAALHNNMGLTYSMKGRNDDAIAEFLEALKLNPGNIQIRFNLAKAYKDKGLKQEARAEFEKVLRLAPGDKSAKKELELFYKPSQ